jgi:hypothetical protein
MAGPGRADGLAEQPEGLPDAGAVGRLLALAAPRDAAFAFEVQPSLALAVGRFRDLGATETVGPFRLGDAVCFNLRAGRDCHVALIDVGTSGALSVLLPNAWCPAPRLDAGQTRWVPGPGFGDFVFRLAGRPGLERVVALAVPGPLPSLLPPAGRPFRQLSAEQTHTLVDFVTRLDPASWPCVVCEFTIDGD